LNAEDYATKYSGVIKITHMLVLYQSCQEREDRYQMNRKFMDDKYARECTQAMRMSLLRLDQKMKLGFHQMLKRRRSMSSRCPRRNLHSHTSCMQWRLSLIPIGHQLHPTPQLRGDFGISLSCFCFSLASHVLFIHLVYCFSAFFFFA
jgi:hypothetical protein